MELLFANLDLILTAAVILIAAVVFARQGQVSLLRELILTLIDTDSDTLYKSLPTVTKMLVSDKTVSRLCEHKITKE